MKVIKKFNEYFLIREADEDEDPFADTDEGGEEGEGTEGEEGKEEKDPVQNSEPEEYVISALQILKRKIEKMFGDNKDMQEVSPNMSDVDVDIDKVKKTKDPQSFDEMGLKLESIEINKNTKTHKSLRVKFTDEVNYYDLYIRISIQEGQPKEDGDEVSVDTVENAFVKFKKLKMEGYELIGTITKNVKIEDIDEDFIISLNSELEEKFGDDEEFKIET